MKKTDQQNPHSAALVERRDFLGGAATLAGASPIGTAAALPALESPLAAAPTPPVMTPVVEQKLKRWKDQRWLLDAVIQTARSGIRAGSLAWAQFPTVAPMPPACAPAVHHARAFAADGESQTLSTPPQKCFDNAGCHPFLRIASCGAKVGLPNSTGLMGSKSGVVCPAGNKSSATGLRTPSSTGNEKPGAVVSIDKDAALDARPLTWPSCSAFRAELAVCVEDLIDRCKLVAAVAFSGSSVG